MKKLLLSTVALAALSATAMAADLPSRRAAPAPYVAVPVFTWTGFYVGVNAGYGFSDNNRNGLSTAGLTAVTAGGVTAPVVPIPGQPFTLPSQRNRDGFVGGGQIGYNYQFGNIVAGVEGDIQYVDFGGGRRQNNTFGTAFPVLPGIIGGVVPGASGNVAFFNRGTGGSDFFGSVRGRLGYAIDRTLIYATGGVAFRDSGSNTGSAAFGFNNSNSKRSDDVGYTVGGGVEYAFTPNITAKVEGLYVNFSGDRGTSVGVTNFGVPVVATGTRSRDDDFAVVRAGINYKFNSFGF